MTSPGSVGGDETLRLFLALRLPDDALDALERWGREALSGGRIVARDALHITLAFLGTRAAGELDAIVEALRAAAHGVPRFPLEPTAWRETTSVGMVVLDDPTGRAAALAGDLHGRLHALGVYEPEHRPWLPHVTVLRFRERPRLLPGLPPMGTLVPSDAAAYLSRLHPTGARYEVLAQVPLDPAEVRRT